MSVRIFTVFCLSLALLAPLPALARNTPHELSIQSALDSPLAQEKLLGLRTYFGDQGHPAIAQTLRKGSSHKATRSMFRSDEEACEIAFLSALIALESQAQSLGANAIVGIRSNTGGPQHSSPSTYVCAAGGAVARVNLTGTYVKLR